MSSILSKPSPSIAVRKPQQPNQVQTEEERQKLFRDLAKRKRATLLSQSTNEPAIRRQTLGAG